MLRDVAGMVRAEAYRLLTQVVVPRPIAWVVSDSGPDAAERWNLAPFSYFTALASEPALVGFSVGSGRDGAVKDTLTNVLARPEHTILIPRRGQLEAVQRTSEALPHGRSELADAGLTPVSWDWPTPRVEGAPVALGCRLDRTIDLAPGQVLVVSRVMRAWIDDAVATEDRPGGQLVDAAALDPLARLGSGGYAGLGPVLRPAGEGGWRPT